MRKCAMIFAIVHISCLCRWCPKDPSAICPETLNDMRAHHEQWRSCCHFPLNKRLKSSCIHTVRPYSICWLLRLLLRSFSLYSSSLFILFTGAVTQCKGQRSLRLALLLKDDELVPILSRKAQVLYLNSSLCCQK